jgi:hypothetical protein
MLLCDKQVYFSARGCGKKYVREVIEEQNYRERRRNRFFAAMMIWRIFTARKYRCREGEGEELNLVEHL